jgi:demethylmenaquinone methyltransferase/2-methoxy-6-polyprenyl-1,4-benzoquinol methylase
MAHSDGISEQIAYYRERAAEYEDFWWRRGTYALAGDRERQWFHDVGQAEQALLDFAPTGAVLEIACGTGVFTRLLVESAGRVTAVDSSPEVIALNRERLAGAAVDYVVADVFDWSIPRGAYDSVVFTYWLSHVPDERLDAFWSEVGQALAPGGRVFLVDSAPDRDSPRGSHPERRTLTGGRSFTVHKRYWEPDELNEDAARRGWHARVRLTQHRMILVGELWLRGDGPRHEVGTR